MNNDKSFNYFVVLVLSLMACVFAFNAYQYTNRPDCPDGVLIQDDAGVYRCVGKDTPIFIRNNGGTYRR